MVKHGTQKKRRSGAKVSRKNIKPAGLKIAQKVKNPMVKEVYDKSKTPAENLQSMGFVSDSNNMKELASDVIDPRYKAFVGFSEIPKTSKKGKLDEFQLDYAKNCIDKYGSDFEAMAKDMKLNYNQMTASKLKKLCISFMKSEHMNLE